MCGSIRPTAVSSIPHEIIVINSTVARNTLRAFDDINDIRNIYI